MVVDFIKQNGKNYIVAFKGGAVRHFFGTELQFYNWLDRFATRMA